MFCFFISSFFFNVCYFLSVCLTIAVLVVPFQEQNKYKHHQMPSQPCPMGLLGSGGYGRESLGWQGCGTALAPSSPPPDAGLAVVGDVLGFTARELWLRCIVPWERVRHSQSHRHHLGAPSAGIGVSTNTPRQKVPLAAHKCFSLGGGCFEYFGFL